jgi:hypothetical protein
LLLPDELPDNTIMPFTEFINEMGVQLEKLGKNDRSSKTSVSCTRTKFNYFSFNKHAIISSACLLDHFFVFTVTFDPTSPTIFERVNSMNTKGHYLMSSLAKVHDHHLLHGSTTISNSWRSTEEEREF